MLFAHRFASSFLNVFLFSKFFSQENKKFQHDGNKTPSTFIDHDGP